MTIESGGVGRAVVGGVLAGGVGAVVGAATRSSKPTTLSLSVRLVTRNLDRPLYKILIIKEATKRDTPEYRYRKRLAEQIYATMISIKKHAEKSACFFMINVKNKGLLNKKLIIL